MSWQLSLSLNPFVWAGKKQIYFSINMKSSIKIELANRKLGTNLALTFGQLENYDCGKGQYVAYNYLAWRLENDTKVLPKILFSNFACLLSRRADLAKVSANKQKR